MKLVTAIVKAEKVKDVESVLNELNVPGFTFYPVKGHGREIRPEISGGRAGILFADILPRKKFEILCPENMVNDVVNRIREKVSTGKPGDGIIYVSSVDRIVRISTGEEGEAVFKH